MASNFNSAGTESNQMIQVIVDSLLSESMEKVKMDSPPDNKDFFKNLLETIPPFSPGEGSQVEVEVEVERQLSPPESPMFPSQPFSPVEPPVAPCPSPIELVESSATYSSWTGSEVESSAEDMEADISSEADLTFKRSCSPGLDLLPTQAPTLPPHKKVKVEYQYRRRIHDLNDNDISEDIEDRGDLIRKLAQRFLMSVPKSNRHNLDKSLNPAGDEEGDSEETAGEELSRELVIIKGTSSRVQLLNLPPRLGLSRLQKKVNKLHDISVSEKEE